MTIAIAIESLSLLMLIFVALVLVKPLLIHSNNKKLILTFGSVIALHSIISIGNGLFGPIYGADNDALRFHDAALTYFDANSTADLILPGWVYSIFLACIYEITQYSWAIGGMLSTVFFAGVLVTCIHLFREFNHNESNSRIDNNLTELKIIVLIGLIPTSIILTSITMREVYQMFFICVAVLYTAKFIKSRRLLDFILMIVALFLFAGLHASFKYYVGIYLLALFCFMMKKFIFSLKNINKIFLLVVVVCGAVLFVDVKILYVIISKFIEGTVGAEVSRAYYGLPPIAPDIFSIMSFMGISTFNYMTRPLPWEMTSYIDIFPFVENVFRIFFIWRIFQLRRYITASMAWVLFAALLLELLWGMGTLNWGTAQRHHLVAWPLFVVVYYAAVSRYKFVKSANTLNKLHCSPATS